MKLVDTQPRFLTCEGDEFIRGPSVAVCPRPGMPGAGDLLLTYDRMDRRKSNVVTSICRSSDGGQSWQCQGAFEQKFIYDLHGSSRRDGYGAIFSDDIRGVMLYLGTELYFEYDKPDSPDFMRKIYYRISFDNGFTWSDKRQIIQQGISRAGRMYDKTHFMHGVTFGKNMAYFVNPNVIRTKDLTLTFGVCSQMADPTWNRIDYNGLGFMQAGAIKAKWNGGALGYDFYFGSWARVEAERSTRGIFEPQLAAINGDRLLMLCRASNAGSRTMLGCKYLSLSGDYGITWSKPEPLLYDDGSVVLSSSSSAVLVPHSDGRLFYVGVVNDRNPNGNFPRHPLVVAEIDKYSCRMRKRSLLRISDKPENFTDDNVPYPADFTGHCGYEDAEGRIVVLAPCRPDPTRFGGHVDRYVIEV